MLLELGAHIYMGGELIDPFAMERAALYGILAAVARAGFKSAFVYVLCRLGVTPPEPQK